MRYIITGKAGATVENITNHINNETEYEVEVLTPTEINVLTDEYKVIYVSIPFKEAWEWYMSADIYNNDMRRLFNDEVIEFRELKKPDYTVEMNCCLNWRSAVDTIINILRRDSMSQRST